jgi:trehalose-6-phosphate synthase
LQGWANFKAANEVVASVIFAQYAAGDVVWSNDYPLLLVPKYLVTFCKEANLPRPAQLFFWHSTFPTSEIFRTLSVRDDLLGTWLPIVLHHLHLRASP